MIRGVNKKVVEISNTESEYFEKILLFVSAEKLGSGEKQLREEAGRLIGNVMDLPPGKRHRGKNGLVPSALKIGCGVLAGAAASACLFLL